MAPKTPPPFYVQKDPNACSADKPHAVKAKSGSVVPGGCHPTPEAAKAHHQKLMSNANAQFAGTLVESMEPKDGPEAMARTIAMAQEGSEDK